MAQAREDILIIGAGSVGTFLAARFAQAKIPAKLVVRDAARARSLSETGLTLAGLDTGHVAIQALAWQEIEKFPVGAQVWVTPKVFQLKEVLKEICKRSDGSQTLVLIQNGLGILDEAQLRLPSIPKDQWVRAICWFGARLEGSTVVTAGGNEVELGGESHALVKRIAKQIEKQLKLEVKLRESVAEAEWHKALWNVAMNGICAIADAQNGAAVADPFLRPLMERVLTEAAEVARAEGIAIEQADLDRVFASARATATNYNSTVQDLRAGRPTEMPWLNGAVLSKAEALGMSVPANEMVAGLVQYLERARCRKKSDSTSVTKEVTV